MITRVRGKIIEKLPPYVVVELNSGLAYKIQVSMNAFEALPELGAEWILHTHLSIREDQHLLYGFNDEDERALFQALIKVNGIGPKVALAILSSMSAQNFTECIMNQDHSRLTTVPGIGKKTAERIVVEMKDRCPQLHSNDVLQLKSDTHIQFQFMEEAVGALEALGFKSKDARNILSKIDVSQITCSQDLIKAALRSTVC